MSFVKHAVIAAAGLGSRLGLGKPKCLLEIGGRPLIHYQLDLLKDVPDVRVVIGFQEQLVIDAVLATRPDAIFVRNPAFRTTTTLTSYALGARHLEEPCLFQDADILFEESSYQGFLDQCSRDCPLIAVTEAKTKDAVFAALNGRYIRDFSRTDANSYEWANLCFLPPRLCEKGRGAVFERLAEELPLPSCVIDSFEIDTPEDYENTLALIRKNNVLGEKSYGLSLSSSSA